MVRWGLANLTTSMRNFKVSNVGFYVVGDKYGRKLCFNVNLFDLISFFIELLVTPCIALEIGNNQLGQNSQL